MNLSDESQMPFGKYRGRAMEDVPPDYLLWLADAIVEGKRPPSTSALAVLRYVSANRPTLEWEVQRRRRGESS